MDLRDEGKSRRIVRTSFSRLKGLVSDMLRCETNAALTGRGGE
jgi:hypothetical protein